MTKSRQGLLLAANEVRQKLYATYSSVAQKKTELLNDIQSDVYTLARLYSLESKMETVQVGQENLRVNRGCTFLSLSLRNCHLGLDLEPER